MSFETIKSFVIRMLVQRFPEAVRTARDRHGLDDAAIHSALDDTLVKRLRSEGSDLCNTIMSLHEIPDGVVRRFSPTAEPFENQERLSVYEFDMEMA